jgi:predicted O-methyltransferase YrrM
MREYPWITTGAQVFFDKYFADNPSAKVLEFGAGGSTIWFANKHIDCITVEHDEKWFHDVITHIKDMNLSVSIILKSRPYSDICNTFSDSYFDFILIDGRDRVECAYASESKLKSGGVLVLDNSERPQYEKIFEMCKDWKKDEYVQTEPDRYGSFLEGWKTTWWIKP